MESYVKAITFTASLPELNTIEEAFFNNTEI